MTVQQIKNLVLIGLATDEELLETLVLKGGNAISLLERGKKQSLSRTSYDLDFSIENDFDGNLDEIKKRIETTIENTFKENELAIFDYSFNLRPSTPQDAVKDFWGGYNIQFKIASKEAYEKHKGNIDALRRNAVRILPNGSPKVEIEISKYEYVGKKMEVEVDGYIIYIYSPEMIVFEKLRAICQQHPQYAQIIPSHSPRPRARDFYDIYLISTLHSVDFDTDEAKRTIQSIFAAKKVPLEFIWLIRENSDIHRADWQSVVDTVSAKEDIKDFDFYLDYTLSKVEHITFP
jgi:predicted nucleotidyltransferase component of viral defense system